MKEFHFIKTYFNKPIYDKSGVRVVIDERPSLNILEEEYSFRITTRFENPKTVHRDYAIEHHMPPAKHSYPHLQFKFHTEEIGQFRLRIDIADEMEYRKAVLGFIFKTKSILEELEKYSKGITNDIMVVSLVNQLKSDGDFLSRKIADGIKAYSIEFDRKRLKAGSFGKLKENKLLLDFIGPGNIISFKGT